MEEYEDGNEEAVNHRYPPLHVSELPFGSWDDQEAVQRVRKKQAAANILANQSRFLLECVEEEVRPSDMKLHLMKVISGMPSALKTDSEKEKLRELDKVYLLRVLLGRRPAAYDEWINVRGFDPGLLTSVMYAHRDERHEYRKLIDLNIQEKNGLFITKIRLDDETRDQSFKLAPKIQIGERGGRVLENMLLKNTEVEACRHQPHGLRVHCVFSQKDAFVLHLKVDEDGGWGLVIPDQDHWTILQAQFLRSKELTISAFRRAEDETLVFLFFLLHWIAGVDAQVERESPGVDKIESSS